MDNTATCGNWPCENCKRSVGGEHNYPRDLFANRESTEPPILALRGGLLWVLSGDKIPRRVLGELRNILRSLCELSMLLERAAAQETFRCECDNKTPFCAMFATWIRRTLEAIHEQLVSADYVTCVGFEYVNECKTVASVLITSLGSISQKMESTSSLR
jgi:hypothetical protein